MVTQTSTKYWGPLIVLSNECNLKKDLDPELLRHQIMEMMTTFLMEEEIFQFSILMKLTEFWSLPYKSWLKLWGKLLMIHSALTGLGLIHFQSPDYKILWLINEIMIGNWRRKLTHRETKPCHYEEHYKNVKLAKSRNLNAVTIPHPAFQELNAATPTMALFVVLVLLDSKATEG